MRSAVSLSSPSEGHQISYHGERWMVGWKIGGRQNLVSKEVIYPLQPREKVKKVKGRITVLSHSEAFQINQRLILRNSRNNTSLWKNVRHFKNFITKADYEFWRR